MSDKKRCVYDIEANGFLRTVDTFWCAGIIDVDTEEEFWFRPSQLKEFLDKLDSYDVKAAHHGAGYDEYALQKLAKIYGIDWNYSPDGFVDTLIMSQVLNYKRFAPKDKAYRQYLARRDAEGNATGKMVAADSHSLARWGIHLGLYKGDWKEFSEFSEGMFEYMKQDVRIMLPLYRILVQELKDWIRDVGNTKIVRAIEIETHMSRIVSEQHLNGWKLDLEKLPEVIKKIDERMAEIEAEVNPKLGMICRKISGDKKGYKHPVTKEFTDDYAKQLKFLKSGAMNGNAIKWFGLPEDADVDKRYGVVGDYCRVEFEAADIGNTDAVKKYLYSIGWQPDDWNGKWVEDEDAYSGRRWQRTSAKITESSLEHLEGAGPINEYYTLRSRKSIMEGWADFIDSDGRLHGDAFNIGTPTFRQSHSVIVNLPSGKAVLGPEVRSLFVAEDGWSVVSADSAACQLRLLSHYMGDEEFLRELLDGDMHQKNADILTAGARRILKDTTILVPRPNAKPFIFAFLYGAGGKKLASILKLPEKVGNALKDEFQKAYPKLDDLINKVKKISKKQGFIIGLDSRPIYCESEHKSLNYLIQGAEAVVMKATVVDIWRRMKEEGLRFRMLLFYHDEVNIEVHNDDIARAKEIIIDSFAEAPKEFGVDIMVCGDCMDGGNYFDVH